MSDIREKTVPDGFQLDWDKDSWNVGHVFRWSPVFECYLKDGTLITVKPGDTLPEAFERVMEHPMFPGDWDVFFVEGMYT
jgi:hypothetical protein